MDLQGIWRTPLRNYFMNGIYLSATGDVKQDILMTIDFFALKTICNLQVSVLDERNVYI